MINVHQSHINRQLNRLLIQCGKKPYAVMLWVQIEKLHKSRIVHMNEAKIEKKPKTKTARH